MISERDELAMASSCPTEPYPGMQQYQGPQSLGILSGTLCDPCTLSGTNRPAWWPGAEVVSASQVGERVGRVGHLPRKTEPGRMEPITPVPTELVSRVSCLVLTRSL